MKGKQSFRYDGGDAQFALYLSLILAELRAIRRLLERTLPATPSPGTRFRVTSEKRKNIPVYRSFAECRAAALSLSGNSVTPQATLVGNDDDFMKLLEEIEDL